MMTWVRNADGCVVGSQDANISNTAFYPPDWQSGGGVIDRHGSFFSLHGQTYFACNDRSHGGNAHFRSTVIVYVNYFRNGTIAPIRIDDTGVGEYNLSADAPIEAEDFFRVAGSARKDEKVTGDGFEVANITDGSTLKYSNAHADSAGAYTLHIRASNGGSENATVTALWLSTTGPSAIGKCMVPPTGAWSTYNEVPCGTLHIDRPGNGRNPLSCIE
eukprot:m.76186 g.76186  ORF g.76186 m.76186 type:complete len:217 (+) comp16183_c0_seq24:1350-2000(+)